MKMIGAALVAGLAAVPLHMFLHEWFHNGLSPWIWTFEKADIYILLSVAAGATLATLWKMMRARRLDR